MRYYVIDLDDDEIGIVAEVFLQTAEEWLYTVSNVSDTDIATFFFSGCLVAHLDDDTIKSLAVCSQFGTEFLIFGRDEDLNLDELRGLIGKLVEEFEIEKLSLYMEDYPESLVNRLQYLGFDRQRNTEMLVLDVTKFMAAQE